MVLAAWAGQNPRLLLNSATDKHPQGLANSSGLLGKYMMAHFGSGTWAIFDEDVQNHMGTTGAQYMSYERYGKTSRKGTFGSTFIVAGSALKTSELGGLANARPDLFGPELAAFMKHALCGITRINAFGEALPHPVRNRGRVRKEAGVGREDFRDRDASVHWPLGPVRRIWMRRAATSASSSRGTK